MTIQHHFICATPECRTHVHVTIVCHDGQPYDLAKLGEALGFRQRKTPTTFTINDWHCEEHAS
jgi:hypothetical protein